MRPARRDLAAVSENNPPPAALSLFAACAPPLEPLVAAELAAVPGAHRLELTPGGIAWLGDLAALYRANLGLRCASRILLRLGSVQATALPQLRRVVARLPFPEYLRDGVRVHVEVTVRRSRLYHSGAVAERVLGAIADSGVRLADSEAATAPAVQVYVRGESDRFTVSLDTSGELLSRRGYRTEDSGAPLRETLAAALLRLAGWDGRRPLVDPTCGSGTLAIEAALLALGRAPGEKRRFAFQDFHGYRPALFEELRDEARRCERPLDPAQPLIHASDLRPEAIAAAQRNAARAGVAEHIRFSVCDVAQARLPEGPPGLILCNPPYGRRLGAEWATLRRLHQAIGRLARSAPGWQLGILTPEPELARAASSELVAQPLWSGGLKVALYLGPQSAEPAAYVSARATERSTESSSARS